jgi:hypothetical protein
MPLRIVAVMAVHRQQVCQYRHTPVPIHACRNFKQPMLQLSALVFKQLQAGSQAGLSWGT